MCLSILGREANFSGSWTFLKIRIVSRMRFCVGSGFPVRNGGSYENGIASATQGVGHGFFTRADNGWSTIVFQDFRTISSPKLFR